MNKKAKMYHGQANIDKYAKVEDYFDNIPRTSTKQIKEAYNEFLNELMLESQEAY